MAQPTAPCTHCGAVLPLAKLVQVDQHGEWVYTCADCAVQTSTGQGPERGFLGLKRKR